MLLWKNQIKLRSLHLRKKRREKGREEREERTEPLRTISKLSIRIETCCMVLRQGEIEVYRNG
ncbi:hypothetical protein PORCAN_43 [Porphyromonas crevioricanis JCM 13913]|nr:hypothetical protein PORCAN_43 [Porphyromonas crevioricanis JCM 13913]